MLGVIILPYKSEIIYNLCVFPSLMSMARLARMAPICKKYLIFRICYCAYAIGHKEYYFGKFCYDKPV